MALVGLALAACDSLSGPPDPGSPAHLRAVTERVDDARLAQADGSDGDWLTYGLSYEETRFSPLAQITTENVERLGLVWSFDLGTRRGIETTPLVVDGILFATGPWSVVYAFDARTGRLLWEFDPDVPGAHGLKACCDVINRGAALYRGRVYVGTIDGRLIALDAATGEVAWETLTVDQELPYTITGAPRIADGKVVIGNGGASMGVRGYVSAYDAATGELAWRTYTVPGDPALGFESEALERAAETWTGAWWRIGGGGTVWDAIVYDPDLDLLYVGTGVGSPINRHARSPEGGDNLFLSSILALDPDDGRVVWHYQTTPGETWDYAATQPIILADLDIDGEMRPVLMQAPKNGFFYVLDRRTGELLSAEPFVEVLWAERVDMQSGKPIETPNSDYRTGQILTAPGPHGAHSWHPMAYSPQTGLVYIPAQEAKHSYFRMGWSGERREGFNAAVGVSPPRGRATGHLLAWNPVEQREVWRVQHDHFWNGGVLATAGGLVFQGTADGRFVAYDAATGAALWEAPMGTGVIAPPVTYLVDGRQYVTLFAGWGGGFPVLDGPSGARVGVQSRGRVFTFALDGDAPYPDLTLPPRRFYGAELGIEPTEAEVRTGGRLYTRHCARCHGNAAISGGVMTDLRTSTPEVHAQFEEIVLGGRLLDEGMPAFADKLTSEETRAIQGYIAMRSVRAAERVESAERRQAARAAEAESEDQ